MENKINGNDKIVSTIIKDAEAVADSVSIKAVKVVDKLLKEAESFNKNYLNEQIEIANKEAEDIIKNKNTLLNLEIKKINLGAKRQVINNLYLEVISMLNNLDKPSYLKVIEKLIKENAEENQVVVIDGKKLDIKDVSSLEIVNVLRLVVEKGDLKDGGIILKGKGFIKDLSFKSFVEDLRRQTETEVAERLFL